VKGQFQIFGKSVSENLKLTFNLLNSARHFSEVLKFLRFSRKRQDESAPFKQFESPIHDSYLLNKTFPTSFGPY